MLDGAALTAVGLGLVGPERVLEVPYRFTTEEQLDHVRSKMQPDFEKGLGGAGYVLLSWGDVGWVHLYSNIPITSKADLQLRLPVDGAAAAHEQVGERGSLNPRPRYANLVSMRRLVVVVGLALLSANALAVAPDPDDAEHREEAREREGEREQEHGPSVDPEDTAPPDLAFRRMSIAHTEALRWSTRMPNAAAHAPDQSWINLGPTDANFESNGTEYAQVDSGRLTGIAVDPRDANVVYVATGGGGVWKTYDFVVAAPNPNWVPITETVGNLAVGGIALDPSNPDTVYVGFGDPFFVRGHAVVKSTDGGASWSAPVILTAAYPAASGGLTTLPRAVRDLKVDPTNPLVVMIGTDVGLFRSTDGGNSYALVDLPDTGTLQVAEAIWSIIYVGGTGAASTWVVSGVDACDHGWLPPWPGSGVAAGTTSTMHSVDGEPCAHGNLGEIWRSTDAGKTWASVRAAFPTPDAGRMRLAAGATTNLASTVVYAMVGTVEEDATNNATLGIWRSNDGGKTWRDATGALANPTMSTQCDSMDLGHNQTWYNEALAVDPTDPDNVVAGGSLCAVRTTNGTAASPTWYNVAHWLPTGGGGDTASGTLPYVHADWHVLYASNVGGKSRVFAGTDGGLFSSTDIFTVADGTFTTWGFHNRGIVTHLSYALGSGDPANGDPFKVLTGMQDNGTRYRDGASDPTVFNQIIGGDGSGCTVNKGTAGEFLWAAVYSTVVHYYCRGDQSDCDDPNNWNGSDPAIDTANGDSFPFVTPYAIVPTDTSGASVLTISDQGVWKSNASAAWTRIGTFTSGTVVRGVSASPTKANVYALALSGGLAAVTTNGTTWTISTATIGMGATILRSVSSVALQPNPPAGHEADTYVVASMADGLDDNSAVPDAMGHLFITTNKGAAFKPLHGNGTGFDLPNVPVLVVRYDPTDTTNKTIYAGTDLGVYVTIDAGLTWTRFGYGLPMVRVSDLFIAKNRSLIRIATFGRGVWEIYPTAGTAKGVDGDGDFDQNQQLDWADLAALSSRLGTNPATAVWPTYSWIDDMTPGAVSPPVNQIDDADLNALLANFGGRP